MSNDSFINNHSNIFTTVLLMDKTCIGDINQLAEDDRGKN